MAEQHEKDNSRPLHQNVRFAGLVALASFAVSVILNAAAVGAESDSSGLTLARQLVGLFFVVSLIDYLYLLFKERRR